ncbi:hypothetical protein AB6N23_01870 [Cellulomonas sp. 179-A 9B4 NHS]|uniref:hypothetical protein n=1 Tax=Cellulomonas sp. 179-A 9B4 NHS TaxID=3142379 RepID=UPI0039A171AD
MDAKLRAWARGALPLEAATELLIRTGLASRYARLGEELMGSRVYLDFEAAAGDVAEGALSSGERAVVAIAVSLSGQVPTDADATWREYSLEQIVTRLDRDRLALVLAALAHAAGTHEHTEAPRVPTRDGGLTVVRDPQLIGPLYPWPSDRV